MEDPAKARWLENYVKHHVKSLGVGIPQIREIVKSAEKEYNLSTLSFVEQKQMLDELMQGVYTEHKLATIVYLQLYWKNVESDKILRLVSQWFDKGWITDWNVCDWLCVRILGPLIDMNPLQILGELFRWNKEENQWKIRASLVSFASCKTIGAHRETIYDFSLTLIKREERFCKTAVGWVLRQYSKIDETFVIDFLEKHKAWTTKEVIKNATKYLPKSRSS